MKRSEIESRVSLVMSDDPEQEEARTKAAQELLTEFLINVQAIADATRGPNDKALTPRAVES